MPSDDDNQLTHEQIWHGAMTLGETVYVYIMSRQTKTPEFQSIINFYGKKKVKDLYEKEKLRRELDMKRKKSKGDN